MKRSTAVRRGPTVEHMAYQRRAAGRPYPQQAPTVPEPLERALPAFLRTVAVPWGGAALVLVVIVSSAYRPVRASSTRSTRGQGKCGADWRRLVVSNSGWSRK